jgi:Na+/H+-dicarboxylate symporter
MKDWLKYVIASAAGLALVLFVPDSQIVQKLYDTSSEIFINLGTYMLIPFVLISFTSGIATLRRSSQVLSSIALSAAWALAASLSLAALSGLISWKVFPARFSGIAGPETIGPITMTTLPEFFRGIIPPNVLNVLSGSTAFLPVIILALLLGIAIKPDEEYIRPAFAVANSFSEAFYRLARIITEILTLGLLFVSAVWFGRTLVLDASFMKGSLSLLLLLGTVTAASVLLILPLLLVVMGKNRRPYLWLFGLLAPALFSWFAGSSYPSQPTLMLHTRYNLGAAKRVSSTSLPLLHIIGRSGTAMVSILIFTSLYSVSTGTSLPFSSLILAIVITVLFSLMSITAPGIELLFIVTMTGRLMSIDFSGNLALVLPLLPFFAGAAALVDTVAAGFGAGTVSRMIQAHSPVKGKDFL